MASPIGRRCCFLVGVTRPDDDDDDSAAFRVANLDCICLLIQHNGGKLLGTLELDLLGVRCGADVL